MWNKNSAACDAYAKVSSHINRKAKRRMLQEEPMSAFWIYASKVKPYTIMHQSITARHLEFSRVLEILKSYPSKKFTRRFSAKSSCVSLFVPDGTNNETPYLYITLNGVFVPWTPSQEDMLAADWYEVVVTNG